MGTVINAAVVIIGGMIGMPVRGGLPPRVRDLLMRSFGLCALFIGISGAISATMQADGTRLQANGIPLLICSLGIGTVAGEPLRLEDRVEGLAHHLRSMVKSRDDKFAEGFVNNALVICIEVMVVVGALQDRLTYDAPMPITKAIPDGIISMVLAFAPRVGVVFAAVLLFPYQGAITTLTGTLSPLFSDTLIQNLLLVENIPIFGTGINLLFGKQMKIGNLLPALLIPVVWEVLQYLVSGMK